MPELAGPLIGSLAVIVIPLVTWFGRRATHQGRLTLRVERLGAIFAVMPQSPEREEFSIHLRCAVGDLNEWLDPAAAKRRQILRVASGSAYTVGVAVAILLLQSVDQEAKPWISPLVGIGSGIAISAVSLATERILKRRARATEDRIACATSLQETAARIEALGVTLRP